MESYTKIISFFSENGFRDGGCLLHQQSFDSGFMDSMSAYFEAKKRQCQREIGLKRILFAAATEFCINKVLKPF